MRLRCNNFKCGKLCTVQDSSNQSKTEFVCPFCEHVSCYFKSVYPNPTKENINKQIDYVLKDVERILINKN